MSAGRALVALSAIALAASAAAFVRSSDDRTGVELSWPTPLVPYHVSDAERFLSPTCDAGPAGDPALDAVQAAFAAWRRDCADLELLYAGQVSEIRTGSRGTGENLVVFRKGWCSANVDAWADPCWNDDDVDCGGIYDCFEDQTPGDRSIVALTSVLYDPDNGRIVDADIEVNGWDGAAGSLGSSQTPHGWYFTCGAPTGGPCATYGQAGCFGIDLQGTVTHEAGHFLGLAHPCEGAQCNGRTDLEPLTMFPSTGPGDVGKRTLDPDDVAGVCAIYPDGRGSGCSTGGAGGALGGVAAVLALWRRRRRQATTTPA